MIPKNMTSKLKIQLLLVLQLTVILDCKILSPDKKIHSCLGCVALFNFTTAEGNKIYFAKWGIGNGNIPQPKFIYIDLRSPTPIINEDYINKVAFVGNLTAGRAWFVLKNLNINDTNEYIAVIRDDASGPNHYHVKLEVRDIMDFAFSTSQSTTLSSTHSTTTKITTTNPITVTNNNHPTNVLTYIIGGIVAGSVGLIIAVVVSVFMVKRKKTLSIALQSKPKSPNHNKENEEPQFNEESQQEFDRPVSSTHLISAEL